MKRQNRPDQFRTVVRCLIAGGQLRQGEPVRLVLRSPSTESTREGASTNAAHQLLRTEKPSLADRTVSGVRDSSPQDFPIAAYFPVSDEVTHPVHIDVLPSFCWTTVPEERHDLICDGHTTASSSDAASVVGIYSIKWMPPPHSYGIPSRPPIFRLRRCLPLEPCQSPAVLSESIEFPFQCSAGRCAN